MPGAFKYLRKILNFYGKGSHKYIYKAGKKTVSGGKPQVKQVIGKARKARQQPTRVQTERVVFSSGKQPRGYGMWAFEHKGKTKFITGNYTDAKKKMVSIAKRRGGGPITLLP